MNAVTEPTREQLERWLSEAVREAEMAERRAAAARVSVVRLRNQLEALSRH